MVARPSTLRVSLIVALSMLFTLESVLAPPSLAIDQASPTSAPTSTPEPTTDPEPTTEPESTARPSADEAVEQTAAPKSVEVVDKRTIDSRTFQNADGSFTTEYHAAPIHYADATGKLQPIEALAVPSNRAGVAFETKAAPARVEFGRSSRDGDPLSVVSGANRLTFRPIEVPGLERAATAAADRAPVAAGGQVTYSGVYPGVDLRYTLLASGVKEDIILTQPATASTFAFELLAPGLDAALQEDGSVQVGTKGKVVFVIPAPVVVDSAAEADGDGVRSTDAIHYELLSLPGKTVLAVVVDPAWLADPARVYPVYVDPTVQTTYAASLDTFISSAYPSSSLNAQWNPGEGGYYELWNGRYDASSGTNYAFVKTGFPAGVSVTSATFSVYVQHSFSLATPTSIYAGRLTSAFTESQTWNMTQPTFAALTSTTVADNQWANFNVTSAVQAWSEATATNHGFRVYESSTAQSLWKRIRARENATNAPKLVVTYTNPVATLVGPTGSAWTNNTTVAWTFSANGSSFAQTKYQAQVSSSSTAWTSPSLIIDSGQFASSATTWTPAISGLLTGTTYYWRVRVFDGHSWSAYTSAAAFRWDSAASALEFATVDGAVSAVGETYYDTGTGTFTVTLRGRDSYSGVKLTYLRLYNATDEMRVQHDWSVGGTHCNEFDTSTLVDATACAETYNAGNWREVTFTVAGLGANTSFDAQYYFTDYAGNTIGYNSTGKTLVFDATAPTGAITAPTAGASVSGTVAISGTASDANFTQYEFHYGAGASPTSWTNIGTNPRTTPVTGGTLGNWDTTSVADGTYTIRLRVYDRARISSGFTEVTRTVSVDNGAPTAIISAPAGDRLIDGLVEIRGTATASASFGDYSLEYGVGCAPSAWFNIGLNPRTTAVSDGLLGTWDTSGLAGEHTVRLTTRRSDGPIATDTVCVTVGSSLGLQAQHTHERWDLGAGDELAVNVVTGNAVVTHPLVVLPYRGDSLPITLTYNARSSDDLGLGVGWQLNLQRRLILNANGTVTFVDGDGARHLFSEPATNGLLTTYARPASLYATLAKDSAQLVEYSLRYRDGSVDRFDAAGSIARLVRHADRHDNAIDLTYGTGNEIAQVSDPSGRDVDFTWTSGELTGITDWAYVDGSGVVQTTATGSRRTYRFFHAAGQLAGWSEPLNTIGTCASPASGLTCLTYTGGLLTGIGKTQTYTTFVSGTLGSAVRPITTEIAYADGRVATVTDAEQAVQTSPARTTFTWADADSVTVARPTTTTAYELLVADDPYARVRSVLRRLDASTSIERRTGWDVDFPIEPATVTDNYGAVLGTPARTVSYLYQGGSLGLASRVVEPLTAGTSRWTEYSYNANHDATEMVVSEGGSPTARTVTRYCYDPACTLSGAGLDLVAQIDSYVAGGPTDNDTNVRIDHAYDPFGQRTSTTRHNRDAAGTVLDDRTDSFTYDVSGNLLAEIVNYANGTVTGGFDLDADPVTQARTDLTTSHAYDTAGNRVSTADPRRAIEGARGTTISADDYVTRWTFDALNRQLTQRTPTTPGLTVVQKTSASMFDELGGVRSATDLGGLVAATEFDSTGRAITTFEDPAGSVAVVTAVNAVDADGKLLSAKDQRQAADASLGVTTYGYDGLGRQIATTEAAGTSEEALTTTGYDALDRRTSYIVGGQDTTYAYDIGGRVLVTDDAFTCTLAAFDYRDLPTKTTHGKAGNGCADTPGMYAVFHAYDGLRRVIRDERVDGTRTLDEVFDAAGNRRSSSTVTLDGATPVTATTTFVVNPLDQLTREVRPDGSTAKLTYDPTGNGADRCVWNAGSTVGDCLPVGTSGPNPPQSRTTSTYDALDKRVTFADGASSVTTTYDPEHNYMVAAAYLPLGAGRDHQTLYAYDGQHRLRGITVQTCAANDQHGCTDAPQTLASNTYEHDGAGNRTRVTESNGAASSDRTYCYDARQQLTGWGEPGRPCSTNPVEVYTYDDPGNRLTIETQASMESFTYSAEGQLTSWSGGLMPPTSFTYDEAGRLLTDERWIYGYDGEGRLVSLCDTACTGASDRVSMTYDADGRRTQIVTRLAGVVTTTDFVYADGRIAAELVNGTLARRYITDESGAAVKIEVMTGSNTGTYLVTWNGHGDALNLSRLNGDGTTTLANTFTYTTWGASSVDTHNGIADLGFRFRYVGQFGVQDDTVHGVSLLLMGARHYAPELGRFIQPDPVRMDPNSFGYAGNGPISHVDPDGSCWWLVWATAAGPVGWGAQAACWGALAAASYLAVQAGQSVAQLAVAVVKAIRSGRRSPAKCVVIGETVSRVYARARSLGCETFTFNAGRAKFTSRAQSYAAIFNANIAWIKQKMAQRYVVVDIGPDFAARRSGKRCASSFYLMEYRMTVNYRGRVSQWTEPGKSVFADARCYD